MTPLKKDFPNDRRSSETILDYSCDKRFYDYYAKESESRETIERFNRIRDIVLRIRKEMNGSNEKLEVADIGCGAGTQSIIRAKLGHNVHGLDVNKPLIQLGRKRVGGFDFAIKFWVGSAVDLPWPDESMDICLVPELLEHVEEWQICLDEFTRVLKPMGILFLTTSNKLCPIQQELNLPMYAWYPKRLKRYFVHLAMTKRPDIVNHAKYPAVNWFTFYSLRDELMRRGYRSMDRFDLIDVSEKGTAVKLILSLIRSVNLFRWLAHVATPYTIIVATKQDVGRAIDRC